MAVATRKAEERVVPAPPTLTEKWDEMEQNFARMFEDFWRRPHFGLVSDFWAQRNGFSVPAVDVYEEKDVVVVKAELPGMEKAEVEVTLTDRTLTIHGEKKREEKVEEKNYFRTERSHGSFTRTIDLPVDVTSGKARASFNKGVLEVRLPKSAAAQPKGKKVRID